MRVRQSAQSGASLIEVLIATLVLAIGLLGIAAALAVSLRNSQGALERSQAVEQTYSMLDVLRGNRQEAIIGRYNMNEWTCTPPASDSRIGADLSAWIASLQENISADACGRIVCTSMTCSVGVRWGRFGTEDDQGDANQEITVVTRI